MSATQIPGKLIVFEGPDFTGKSTAIRGVRDQLKAEGRSDIVFSREPGGTPLAEAIRGLVLSNWDEGVSREAEVLMMYAARAAHVAGLVRPALEFGRHVILDRFTLSSHVFQGLGRGVPSEVLQSLDRLVLGDLRPDLTLVLNAPVETLLKRAKDRGQLDRFEAVEQSLMEERVEFYQRAAAADPNALLLDATLPPEEVVQAALHAIRHELQQGQVARLDSDAGLRLRA